MGCGDGLHRGGAVGAHQGLTFLFYDGGCSLCGGAVRVVAKYDRSGQIRFAPLGGATYESLLPAESRDTLPDSLVVVTPEGDLLILSAAVIHLLHRMGPAWRLAGRLLAWIPGPLRDAAYRLMARLRARKRSCALGSASRDERFHP